MKNEKGLMVAKKHIEKFMVDYPLFFPERRRCDILQQCTTLADPMGSAEAAAVLEAFSSLLFHHIETDCAYIRISVERAA